MLGGGETSTSRQRCPSEDPTFKQLEHPSSTEAQVGMPLPQHHGSVCTVELRQDHHRKIREDHGRGRNERTPRNHDEGHAYMDGPRNGVEPNTRIRMAKIPVYPGIRTHRYGIHRAR